MGIRRTVVSGSSLCKHRAENMLAGECVVALHLLDHGFFRRYGEYSKCNNLPETISGSSYTGCSVIVFRRLMSLLFLKSYCHIVPISAITRPFFLVY